MQGEVVIRKERTVRTDFELWHTSWCLVEAGKETETGSAHQFRASLIFTAFALEAYLNHLGPQLLQNWISIERRRSPQAKLKLLCRKLAIKADWSARPWLTINELFSYRNSLAHGRGEELKEVYRDSVENYQKRFYDLPRAQWEKYSSLKTAQQARDDVDVIVNLLHQKGGAKMDFPFYSGMNMASAGS
jgi:hypothetical protein